MLIDSLRSFRRSLGLPPRTVVRRRWSDRPRAACERLEDRTLLTATPIGPEVIANTYTADAQNNAGVAMDSDSNYVVVWDSYNQGGTGREIYGQRFAADGTPLGGEFHVNTYTTNDQRTPAVAMADDGAFVVVWESAGQDGDGDGIYGQRFDANGVALGSEFRANVYTGSHIDAWVGHQDSPDVAMDAAGNFVVAWDSNQDSSGAAVIMRRFRADGVALTGDVQVNTYEQNHQHAPSIAMNAVGDFVVVWRSVGQDGGPSDTYEAGVYGQRFDANGEAVGDEFHVNDYTPGNQWAPDVAMNDSGAFVVAWADGSVYSQGLHGRDGSGAGVYARRYDTSGNPLALSFRVNEYVAKNQWFPAIAVRADGGFIVAWASDNNSTGSYDISAREYDSTGVATAEFRVNTYADYAQVNPAIAFHPTGPGVVAWASYRPGTHYEIGVQRFTSDVANDPPVSDPFSIVTNEDTIFEGQLSATDPEGDELIFAEVTDPQNGYAFVSATGVVRYVGKPDFNGTDSFTYTVSDGTNTVTQTISITITPVNDAPRAGNMPFTTLEDIALSEQLLFLEAEGDPVVFSLETGPTHGKLTLNDDGSFTYTPDPDFSGKYVYNEFWNDYGSDSFTYRVTDDQGAFTTGIVVIDITPVNDAPEAADDTLTVAEDGTLTIDATAVSRLVMRSEPNDWVGRGLSYDIQDTTHTFDGRQNSGNGVRVWITGPNGESWNLEFAAPGSALLTIGEYLNAMRFPFQDPDRPGLSVSGNGHGSNELTGEFYVYDVVWNADQTDVVSFAASFEQHSEGKPPALLGTIQYNTTIGTHAGVLANDTDADGDFLTTILVDGPANGTLTLNRDGTLSYTPNANFTGVDSFTYRVTDGTLISELATVSITVAPENDAPTAGDLTAAGAEDQPITGTLPGEDIDGDNLTYEIVGQPANGVVSINAATGEFTYTPAAGFVGTDTFTYQVSDGTASSNTATVTVTIAPMSDTLVVNFDPLAKRTDNVHTLGRRSNSISTVIYGSESLDVRDIDLRSLRLTIDGVEYSADARRNGQLRYTFRDVNHDGHKDLVIRFDLDDARPTDGPTAAILSGELENGTAIGATGEITLESKQRGDWDEDKRDEDDWNEEDERDDVDERGNGNGKWWNRNDDDDGRDELTSRLLFSILQRLNGHS